MGKKQPVSWSAKVLLIMHFIALVFGSVALLTPFWYMEDPHNRIGLWAKCARKSGFGQFARGGCQWAHENDLYWERIQPQWFVVCQVLMALAVFTQWVVFFILIRINILGNVSLIVRYTCGLFIILAWVEILSTVAHFGYHANRERGVVIDKEAFRHFGWSYLLAILSMVFEFVTFPFYVLWWRRAKRRKNIMRNPHQMYPGTNIEMRSEIQMQTFPLQPPPASSRAPSHAPPSSNYGQPNYQQQPYRNPDYKY